MTPEELYRYDVNGYMLVKNAIEPQLLAKLLDLLDEWEENARVIHEETGREKVRYDDILNMEHGLLNLVANPIVLPFLI